MNKILNFEEFLLESRIPIAWAKPNKLTLTVLSYIGEKEKVTKKELMEFLESIPEDLSGKKPSKSWIRGKKKYIGYKIQEEDANYYYLTTLGKRVLRSSKINETT